MADKVVYRQTAKGREELAASSGNLGPNLKNLLGMFDGESTLEDLQKKIDKLPLQWLLAARDKLVAKGYIELSKGAPPQADLDFATLMNRQGWRTSKG